MVCVVAATGSGKSQARPPTYHFEKLLEETCSNHAFPVKLKLRDYDMMKNFMASRSIVRGMEVDEVPNEGNTTSFLKEDVVMINHDGRPSPGMRRTSNPSLGTPARCSWGCRNAVM
jgi:hypothetical protein